MVEGLAGYQHFGMHGVQVMHQVHDKHQNVENFQSTTSLDTDLVNLCVCWM